MSLQAHKYSKLVEEASKHPHSDKLMAQFHAALIDQFSDLAQLEDEHVDRILWHTVNKMHESIYGPHFDEHTAKDMVAMFKNDDGTHGEHWCEHDTTSVAQQSGIAFNERVNKWDFYVLMNMLYSDYRSMFMRAVGHDKPAVFVEMAKSWINDVDGTEGKIWKYIMRVK